MTWVRRISTLVHLGCASCHPIVLEPVGTDRLPGHGMIPWVEADVVPLLEHLRR